VYAAVPAELVVYPASVEIALTVSEELTVIGPPYKLDDFVGVPLIA
jgi:hypothetical protein